MLKKVMVVSLSIVTIIGIYMVLSFAHGDAPCEIGSMVEAQTDAYELLENFAKIADDDFSSAVEQLWNAGYGLQHMAEECGFKPPENLVSSPTMDMSSGSMDGHQMIEIPSQDQIMELAMSIGDPENGDKLFHTFTQTGFACATCHYPDSNEKLVGPGLQGVAYLIHMHGAGVETLDLPFAYDENAPISKGTLQYIYTSIVNPDAVIVSGFPDNLMPEIYSDVFTEEELSDILAYLVTLAPETATN